MNPPLQTATPDPFLYLRSAGSTRSGSSQSLLGQLLGASVIHPDDWDSLPKETGDQLFALDDRDGLLRRLAELHLINAYQADRIKAGMLPRLVFGNYRVLGSMGSGGGSVVFEAEHVLLRRKVAIKVLPVSHDEDPTLLARFLRELARWPGSIIPISSPPSMPANSPAPIRANRISTTSPWND